LSKIHPERLKEKAALKKIRLTKVQTKDKRRKKAGTKLLELALEPTTSPLHRL
jgi:hypothetical protein